MLEQDYNGHYRSGSWGIGKDYGTNKDSASMGYFADKYIKGKQSSNGKSGGGSLIGTLIIIAVFIFSIKWLIEEHPVVLFILFALLVIFVTLKIIKKIRNGLWQKVNPLLEDEKYSEAKEFLEKLANKYNDPTACDILGNIYSYGNGVELDLEKSKYYYERALKFGEKNYAPYRLAQIMTPNIDNLSEESIDYLMLASKNLNSNASCDLAIMYITQNDEKYLSDYNRLYKQILKNAKNGNAECQYTVGIANATGVITEKNPEKAVEWYRKSAEQGYCQAIEGLIKCYEEGFGVTQNLEEAEKWRKMINVSKS